MSEPTVTIPASEYARLLAAEARVGELEWALVQYKARAALGKARSSGLAIFERQSKELMNSLASGKLPTISPETLSAARDAVNRQITRDSESEWMENLATKVSSLKD